MRRLALVLSFGLSMAGGAPALAQTAGAETAAVAVETPIVIGRSYALPSAIMGQTREINVWLPPGYADSGKTYPVLYVLDGGQDQDFHHISGPAQLGTVVGTTFSSVSSIAASSWRMLRPVFHSCSGLSAV